MELTAKQIKYLIDPGSKDKMITLESCEKMIQHCRGYKADSCHVLLLDEVYPHYAIKERLDNIQTKYLVNKSTYGYIVNYPMNKINNSKNPVKRVKIPSKIRGLLTQDQIIRIIGIWQTKYNDNMGLGIEFS